MPLIQMTDRQPDFVVPRVEGHFGDCEDVCSDMGARQFDALVTDPPYGLEFMDKDWDKVIPGKAVWEAIKWTIKPGGWGLIFGGTRTYHRLACAVEDAGFEVRDCVMWLYGTGFPKGKGCLKPAWEPVLLCRKPGPKVLPLGIDECRVPSNGENPTARRYASGGLSQDTQDGNTGIGYKKANYGKYAKENSDRAALGRYPANVVHDGSDEVLEAFAAFDGKLHGAGKAVERGKLNHAGVDDGIIYREGLGESAFRYGDSGSAARFFYCAKASRAERGEGNTHPTVKPLALMGWLVRLVCPPGGKVLDPYFGSGTTGLACRNLGRNCAGIERDLAAFEIARKRICGTQGQIG